jgi:Zn-dependent protease with chaperone function/tetratricopeptide (TPR) repeat protein
MIRRSFLLIVLLSGIVSVPFAPAQPPGKPPSQAMSVASWAEWSKWLTPQVNEQTLQKLPAFAQARKFLRSQANSQGQLPRTLESDPTAWLILGDAYFSEAGKGPTSPLLGHAERAFRKAAELTPQSGLPHYLLAMTLLRMAVPDPAAKGESSKPNIEMLREVDKELKQAHLLDNTLPRMDLNNQAMLAYWIEDYAAAEPLMQQFLKEHPDNLNMTKNLARSIVNNKQHAPPRAADVKSLADRFPNDGVLASLSGFAFSLDGDKEAALKEYDRARSLGTDPARVLPAGTIPKPPPPVPPSEHAKSFLARLGLATLLFIGVYAVIMLTMSWVGLMLARRTRGAKAMDLLGSAPHELVANSRVIQTSQEAWLNRFYGFALFLGLVFFYAAFPFLIVGLIIMTLMIVVFGIFLHRDPQLQEMHGDLIRAGSGSTWSVIRSLFIGFGSGSFGIRKTEAECPRLFAAVKDVAQRVDTDPVDEIWIAPGADISVHQEGRGPFGLFGSRRRVLTLGLCMMPYMTVTELKSILAHEYAHFSHQDTMYNRFVAQVSLAIGKARQGMAETGGWVTWINPFYWFFFLYAKSYALLSSGFSRSREYLADRMACCLYGGDVFVTALHKAIAEGSLFEMTIYENIIRKLAQGKAYVNAYEEFRKFRNAGMTAEEREQFGKKIIQEKPSLFASHPTFSERVEAAKALPCSNQKDTVPARNLFEKPDEIEKELTDFLTGYVNYLCHKR